MHRMKIPLIIALALSAGVGATLLFPHLRLRRSVDTSDPQAVAEGFFRRMKMGDIDGIFELSWPEGRPDQAVLYAARRDLVDRMRRVTFPKEIVVDIKQRRPGEMTARLLDTQLDCALSYKDGRWWVTF